MNPDAHAPLRRLPATDAPDHPARTLDVSTLPAPEPMIRILEAVATLRAGESLRVEHSRVPHLLYPRLSDRGLEVETREHPDGRVTLIILRPKSAGSIPPLPVH